MTRPRRIQITHIHPEDAHYEDRANYIGAKGAFKLQRGLQRGLHYPGYHAGDFYPDNPDNPDNQELNPSSFFIAVRYKKI